MKNDSVMLQQAFSKADTQVVKGIAILLLMWHHCFLKGRFESFNISFFPLSTQTVTNIASFFKISVSLFAFVSGYGLFIQLKKLFEDNRIEPLSCFIFTVKRYLRTFSGYWFVVVLVWSVTALLDGNPYRIYFGEGTVLGLWYMFIDFIGLGRLFDTPMMIATWWYMSAAFVFIIVAPLLFATFRKFGTVFCFAVMFIIPRISGVKYPGGTEPITFLPAFMVGMAFAKHGVFERISSIIDNSRKKTCGAMIISCLAVLLCYYMAMHFKVDKYWDLNYGLFVSAYISFIWLTFRKLTFISKVLGFFGKHSANVFLIHNFIRVTYLEKFIYSRGHFILIMGVLFGISLVLSLLIELFKNVIGYNKHINNLISSIETRIG